MALGRFYSEVYDLRPWYHDFARLGLQTRFAARREDQLKLLLVPLRRRFDRAYVEKGERFSLRQFIRPSPPPHSENQLRKEAHIVAFIQRCLQDIGTHGASSPVVRCADLFCADGYYTCVLARMSGAVTVTGVDLDGAEIRRAQTAARVLGIQPVQFAQADVWEFVRAAQEQAQAFDLVLCTGGLYHLTDPRGFLRLLRGMGGRFLVVQSVVTLESADPAYFVSPAPGWRHGSRFTHAGLGRWLEEAGWRILEASADELSGNARQCDRGSSYYRCVAAEP